MVGSTIILYFSEKILQEKTTAVIDSKRWLIKIRTSASYLVWFMDLKISNESHVLIVNPWDQILTEENQHPQKMGKTQVFVWVYI